MPPTSTKDDTWKPTAGKDSRLDMYLNQGAFNGYPIYIHLTTQGGHVAIKATKRIASAPNAARRGVAAQAGVYLNPSIQTFDPATACTLLFFEEARYLSSSDYCIVFAFNEEVEVEQYLVTHGSWVKEIIYRGDIEFKEIEILYEGVNPFASLARQNHLRG